jgi:hypothetical protein
LLPAFLVGCSNLVNKNLHYIFVIPSEQNSPLVAGALEIKVRRDTSRTKLEDVSSAFDCVVVAAQEEIVS